MSIDQLASGSYRARVMIDGQRYTATFPTRDEADEWLLLTRARAITGELPPRISLEQYASRWLDAPDAPADPARDRHAVNLKRYVLPSLGRLELGDIVPTNIKRLLVEVTKTSSTATADEVHEACAVLFDAAVAEGTLVRSPVPPRRTPPVLAAR